MTRLVAIAIAALSVALAPPASAFASADTAVVGVVGNTPEEAILRSLIGGSTRTPYFGSCSLGRVPDDVGQLCSDRVKDDPSTNTTVYMVAPFDTQAGTFFYLSHTEDDRWAVSATDHVSCLTYLEEPRR